MTNGNSWPAVALGDLLTDIQPGFASGRHNSEGTGLPHLRPMNVSSNGQIDRAVLKFVDTALADQESRRLRRGDVLFNNTNSPELVGKTALFDSDDQPAFSNHMTRLRVDPSRLDPGFLALRLHQAWREGWFAAHCNNHVSQASVGRDVLRAFEIELPPLEIQRAIRALGQAAKSRGMSARDHLASARRAIERFRRAVLAAACSGRLTADWREANPAKEPASELVSRSQEVVAALSTRRAVDEPWSEPDWLEIPDSWRCAPLHKLAAIKGGIQKQPKRTPKNNPYPYLRVANVLRGRLDLSEIHQFELFNGEMETYRLLRGDLLVVEGNGSPTEIGRAAIWQGEIPDCVHQNHIIRVRCLAMDPRFVEMFWNSPIGSREVASLAVTSAGLYSLSTKKIGAVTVPVPPLDEQHEIVRRASDLLALADALASRVEQATRRVERSSQAVLAKALRGDFVPAEGEST